MLRRSPAANLSSPERVEPKPLAGRRSPTSAVDLIHGEAQPVRVLVVDDHPAFRRALSSALSLVADIEVAGEAGGGVAACTEA